MQTIVYQCDTAMPAQKLPNCCISMHVEYLFPPLSYIFFSTDTIIVQILDTTKHIIQKSLK